MSKKEQIELEFAEKVKEIEQRFMQLSFIQAQADKAIRDGFEAMRDKELEALSSEYGLPVSVKTGEKSAIESDAMPKPPGFTGLSSE